MALITIGSSKGGVGKSTTALVLGQVLAQQGSQTKILEYDENRPLAAWQQRARAEGYNKPLLIEGGFKDEQALVAAARKSATQDEFTIVDFPGQAQVGLLLLAQLADIVLIPMKETFLDAEQAKKVMDTLNFQQDLSKRAINYKIVLSAVENIKTKEARAIDESLEEQGIPVLRHSLPRRAAFSAIFSCSCSLYELGDEVKNPGKIRSIAEDFVREIIQGIGE